MPIRFVHLAVDSADPAPIARFWSALLGWPIDPEEDDEEVYIEGEHMGIVFVPVPGPKTVKNRVHLDLASASEAHQQETVARALELGARHTDIGQRDVPFVVLADPDGNEFCVLDPRPEYLDIGPLAAIVQDCRDPAAVAPFWSALTGRPIVRQNEEFASIRLFEEGGPWLELLAVPDPKRVKNRVHLDLAPLAGEDHAAEVARMLALGATRVDVGQGKVSWEVLADPEGSEFCILSPRD